MATINVLVVVDVVGANTAGLGGLANNVWMLDTSKYLGTQEAGNELVILLNAGDEIIWSLAAIDPGTNLTFPKNTNPFTGQAVPANINPQPVPLVPNQYVAIFDVPGGTPANTQYQYSMVLSMDGQNQTFDPFLKLFTAT